MSEKLLLHIFISLLSIYTVCQMRRAQGRLHNILKHENTRTSQHLYTKACFYWRNTICVNLWPCNLESFWPDTELLCKSDKKRQLEQWERWGGCETDEKPFHCPTERTGTARGYQFHLNHPPSSSYCFSLHTMGIVGFSCQHRKNIHTRRGCLLAVRACTANQRARVGAYYSTVLPSLQIDNK